MSYYLHNYLPMAKTIGYIMPSPLDFNNAAGILADSNTFKSIRRAKIVFDALSRLSQETSFSSLHKKCPGRVLPKRKRRKGIFVLSLVWNLALLVAPVLAVPAALLH